jgi:hypothetical protein
VAVGVGVGVNVAMGVGVSVGVNVEVGEANKVAKGDAVLLIEVFFVTTKIPITAATTIRASNVTMKDLAVARVKYINTASATNKCSGCLIKLRFQSTFNDYTFWVLNLPKEKGLLFFFDHDHG